MSNNSSAAAVFAGCAAVPLCCLLMTLHPSRHANNHNIFTSETQLWEGAGSPAARHRLILELELGIYPAVQIGKFFSGFVQFQRVSLGAKSD